MMEMIVIVVIGGTAMGMKWLAGTVFGAIVAEIVRMEIRRHWRK